MKKRLLLFAILFFGLCGCDKDNGEDVDPPGIGHFVWVNASDHRITMTVNGQFEDEIMLPGERISKTMIGFIALPPSPDLYVMHGIEIVFDDGPYGGVFTRPKEYPAAPYNPCNEKEYVWEDMPVENDLSHWVWTYTFTNADYDALRRGFLLNIACFVGALPIIRRQIRSRHSRIRRALSRTSSSVIVSGGEMRNAVSQ